MGLATRLFAAQLIVIVVAGVTLLVTVALVAPRLFVGHLDMTGEDSPMVQLHAREAFESAVGVAFTAAAIAAVAAAVVLSWLLSRRVSRPVEELAQAAQLVASGTYDISVPESGFGPELTALAASFQTMADDLAATDRARGSLLADLAHELRTPLATLEAHIDGLEDGIVQPSGETFDVMRAQVTRLQRLTDDIKLTAAAQEHALDLHLLRVPVSKIVTTACGAAEPRFAGRGVTLSCGVAPDATVMADPDRIQQVMANLLDNALRHTPPDGTVSLSAEARDGRVRIAIVDTGDGIPADQLDAIFRRFHRVDPSRRNPGDGGSGLGLTIARAIIEDHGGTLTAASQGQGSGTTMTITLPTAPTG